jgi:hypothetical protein
MCIYIHTTAQSDYLKQMGASWGWAAALAHLGGTSKCGREGTSVVPGRDDVKVSWREGAGLEAGECSRVPANSLLEGAGQEGA